MNQATRNAVKFQKLHDDGGLKLPPLTSGFWDEADLASQDDFAALASLAWQRHFFRDKESRLQLVAFLQSLPFDYVGHHLVDVAVFAPEPVVRKAAIAALKVRKTNYYQHRLIELLRFPLPSVVNNSVDAIIALEVDCLDEFDEVLKIRNRIGSELVKINHNRNCVLCHPPGRRAFVSLVGLNGKIPNSRAELPKSLLVPGGFYSDGSERDSVRVDVTYLVPEFSLMLPVDPAVHNEPWPVLQRFDFLLRDPQLSDKDIAAYEKARRFLPPLPSQQAALRVLRHFTGRHELLADSDEWRDAIAVYYEKKNQR